MRRSAASSLVLAALASALGAASAQADPLEFNGARPKAPHVVVKLSREQKALVAAAPETRWAGQRVKHLVLALEPAQQQVVRASTGRLLTWVDALSRPYLEIGCDCESANAAVLGTDDLAVLESTIDDVAISPDELVRVRAAFIDPHISPPEEPPPSQTAQCTETIETRAGVAWRDAAKIAFVTLAAHAFRAELRDKLPALMDLLQAAPWPGEDVTVPLPKGWSRAAIHGRLLQEPYWTWQFAQPGESVVDGWMMHASELRVDPPRPGRLLAWPETAVRKGLGGDGNRIALFFPAVNAEGDLVHPYWIAATFHGDLLEAAVEFPVARAGALTGRGRTVNLSLFAPSGALFVGVFPDDERTIRLEIRECGVTLADR